MVKVRALRLLSLLAVVHRSFAVPCTTEKTEKCCGDDVCDGPETSQNCAADCTGKSPSPNPGGGGGACTTVPDEKPKDPTLCTAQNQGCCECGSGDLQTYVFWPGDGSQQRCFHAYNVPSSPPGGGAYAVLLHMDGYSGGRSGQDNQGAMGTAAKYYGFATITLGSLLKDGAGGFGLEFGNSGVVSDANPMPCSSEDSREIAYLEGVFKFIADNPTTLDAKKVYTEGFSQNSMFAIYTAVCFQDRVAGAWQGGSGLSRTGYAPVTPGFQAQCSLPSYLEHETQCCKEGFCTECQYWPVYPKKCSSTLVDCIAAYTDDGIACGTDWYMYEAMAAEGHDARLLSFTGSGGVGGHKNPENMWSWITGCLGLVPSCSGACASSFATCAAGGGHQNFSECENKIKAGTLSDCTSGCAPTLAMLRLSQDPVVTLSEGKFGTETGLTKASGSAPKPNCTAPFGKFSDSGVSTNCQAPSSFTPKPDDPAKCGAPSPTPYESVGNSPANDEAPSPTANGEVSYTIGAVTLLISVATSQHSLWLA